VLQRIFSFSFVGGIAVGEGRGVHGGTKYAVEGLSEAMRREPAPLGHDRRARGVRTDFLDGSGLHAAQAVPDDHVPTADG
jgi:hypothetical protein